MTILAARATTVDRLVAWISAKAGGEVSVEELYEQGPTHFGTTEVELREWVNEGLREQRLAIRGLTSYIGVRRADESARQG